MEDLTLKTSQIMEGKYSCFRSDILTAWNSATKNLKFSRDWIFLCDKNTHDYIDEISFLFSKNTSFYDRFEIILNIKSWEELLIHLKAIST